jgi:hypothetical protein
VALSVIVTVAVRTPAAAGVKDTETVQLPPKPNVVGAVGQLLLYMLKSPGFVPPSA